MALEIYSILPDALDELKALGSPEEVAEKAAFHAKVSGKAATATENPFAPYRVQKGVLTIPVTGMLLSGVNITLEGWITGYEYVQETLAKGVKDSNVKSIDLAVNSPGGYVSGMFETAEMISEANKIKPVTANITGVGASAAYALSAAAGHVTAGASSVVGSVGVIVQHASYAKQLDKAGIEMSTFKSGKYKDFGSPTRALSKEERTKFQTKVDDLAAKFFDLVAEGRDITADSVKALEADVFDGTEAIEKGLVDEIASPKTTLTKEKTMSEKKPAAAEKTVDVEAVASEARAEGVKSEQDRVAAILAHEKAASHMDTVAKLIETGVAADTAIALLDTLTEKAVEAPTEDVVTPSEAFEKAMGEGNPEIAPTADTDGESENAEADQAAEIVADYKTMKGIV